MNIETRLINAYSESFKYTNQSAGKWLVSLLRLKMAFYLNLDVDKFFLNLSRFVETVEFDDSVYKDSWARSEASPVLVGTGEWSEQVLWYGLIMNLLHGLALVKDIESHPSVLWSRAALLYIPERQQFSDPLLLDSQQTIKAFLDTVVTVYRQTFSEKDTFNIAAGFEREYQISTASGSPGRYTRFEWYCRYILQVPYDEIGQYGYALEQFIKGYARSEPRSSASDRALFELIPPTRTNLKELLVLRKTDDGEFRLETVETDVTLSVNPIDLRGGIGLDKTKVIRLIGKHSASGFLNASAHFLNAYY